MKWFYDAHSEVNFDFLCTFSTLELLLYCSRILLDKFRANFFAVPLAIVLQIFLYLSCVVLEDIMSLEHPCAGRPRTSYPSDSEN